MTDAWQAAAVGAMQDAMRRRDSCACYGHAPTPCNECMSAMLRAALPHLLRAVVEGMTNEESVGIARHIAAADPRPQGMAECATLMRAALLAALTSAAKTLDESREG